MLLSRAWIKKVFTSEDEPAKIETSTRRKTQGLLSLISCLSRQFSSLVLTHLRCHSVHWSFQLSILFWSVFLLCLGVCWFKVSQGYTEFRTLSNILLTHNLVNPQQSINVNAACLFYSVGKRFLSHSVISGNGFDNCTGFTDKYFWNNVLSRLAQLVGSDRLLRRPYRFSFPVLLKKNKIHFSFYLYH